jgi:hypothetical protein
VGQRPEWIKLCSSVEPEFKEYGSGHFAACHWVEKYNGAVPSLATGPVVVEAASAT